MRLTAGGKAIVVLILGLYYATVNTSLPLFYLVIALLLAVLLVNLIFSFQVPRVLDISRDCPSHVCEKKEYAVKLTVTNPTPSPKMILHLFDETPQGLNPIPLSIDHLVPRSRTSVVYKTRAVKRGVYRLSSCLVESAFPFGLCYYRRKLPVISEIVVYPLYYEITAELLPAKGESTGSVISTPSVTGSSSNFYGIREYQSGDPLRRVDWKATAKTSKLMVKQFEQDILTNLVIVLDTQAAGLAGPDDDSSLEYAVRTAASIANHTLAQNSPVSLMYYSEEFKTTRIDRTQGDLTPIFDSLARVQPSRSLAAEKFLEQAMHQKALGDAVVLILLEATIPILKLVMSLRYAGRDIILILIDKATFASQPVSAPPDLGLELERCRSIGIKVAVIGYGDDINRCLQSSGLRGLAARR